MVINKNNGIILIEEIEVNRGYFIEDKVFAVFLAEPIADTIAVLTTCLAFAFEFKHIMAKMDENDTRIVSKHHIINN